jgi:hypothetical protein
MLCARQLCQCSRQEPATINAIGLGSLMQTLKPANQAVIVKFLALSSKGFASRK